MNELNLEISLFGVFQVRLCGELITRFESTRVRALLAYLAAEAGHPQVRSVLAGLLWPDWPEEAASKNLRHTLYSLRQTLQDGQAQPPQFHSDRQFITFQPEDSCQVDALELEKALALVLGSSQGSHQPASDMNPQDSAVDQLRSAVALYRGPFLDGFTLKDSPAFEAWVLSRREYHSQKIQQAFSFLVDWHERRGLYKQAESYARRRLEVEPWQENAHQQLMRILAVQGESGQATAQFENLRRILKTELGVEPSADTLALFESIRSGRFVTDQKPVNLADTARVGLEPSHNLPVQLTSFIGREKEISEVCALLHQHRLVTLTGPGGVGKTRLSLRVAEELQQTFTDGVWFVELASVRDADLLVQSVAATFGLKVNGPQPIAEVLKDYLSLNQALLVLDNCEHLVEACAFLVNDLLRLCRKVKILTSSREVLGVSGEIAFQVPSLTLPEPIQSPHLADLEHSEAVRLLVERASTVQEPFLVTAFEAEAVAQICQRLDGIPLAIELAAARLAVLSPSQLADRLDNAFKLLTNGARTALPRQQTLRATIDWSYQLLTEQEKGLLRRLAIFTSSFDFTAVEVVCGRGVGEETDASVLLASLVNKSLLQVESSSKPGKRFRLLETVRQFAREELVASGEITSLRDLHAVYYLDQVILAREALHSMESATWLRRLDVDLGNLRAAMAWSLVGELGNKGVCAIIVLSESGYWWTRGILEEGRSWLEKFLKRVDRTQPDYPQLLCIMGAILGSLNQRTEAIQYFQTSQSVAQQMGDRLDYARAVHRLATYTRELYGEARSWEMKVAHYQEASAIFRELGAERDLAFLVHSWGGDEFRYGKDLAQAMELLNESERLYQKLGDAYIAYVWFNQGWVYQQLGQNQRGRELFLRALPWFREIDDQWGMMFVVNYLGELDLLGATNLAEVKQAEEVLLEGLGYARKFGNRHIDLAMVLNLLGIASLRLGDFPLSLERFTEALTIFRGFEPVFRDENQYNICVGIIGLAVSALYQDDLAGAARWLGVLETKQQLMCDVWEAFSFTDFAQFKQQVSSRLTESAFQAAWSEGQKMSLDEALNLV